MRYSLEKIRSMPPFDRSVSVLCWAYNEEELIGQFLLRLDELMRSCVADYEIVVVDDCSTDRTNQIVREQQESNPRIRLVRHERNLNVGYACRTAIASATKEFLFWQTIDWAYDLSFLRAFLELLRDYDVVAGVRREPIRKSRRIFKPFLGLLRLFGIKHLAHRSDSVPKALVSVANYCLVRTLFNVPLSDYQNVVFYPTKLIQSISFEAKSSFLNPEGLLKSYWKGASIAEVPIRFLSRTAGQAKGTSFRAIRSSVGDIFRLWFKWIILRRRAEQKKGIVRRLQPAEWDGLSLA